LEASDDFYIKNDKLYISRKKLDAWNSRFNICCSIEIIGFLTIGFSKHFDGRWCHFIVRHTPSGTIYAAKYLAVQHAFDEYQIQVDGFVEFEKVKVSVEPVS
jgi:hypothetical protein